MNLHQSIATTALILASTSSPAASGPQIFPPATGVHQYAGCPGTPGPNDFVKAVDASNPVNDAFLKGAKRSGVQVIIRYYEWPDAVKGRSRAAFNQSIGSKFDWREGPVWAGKRLDAKELKRIHENFKVAVVFQHNSSSIRTFQDPVRPAIDAKASTDLAQKFSQPINTVIFFGADFAVNEKNYPAVEQYFKVLSPLVKAKQYKVGVYGDGYVCKMLKQNGYVSHCWLSQSTDKAYVDSIAYDKEKKWEMKQCASRAPYKKGSTDFNPDIMKDGLDDVSF